MEFFFLAGTWLATVYIACMMLDIKRLLADRLPPDGKE
jgi:hypothetical protein